MQLKPSWSLPLYEKYAPPSSVRLPPAKPLENTSAVGAPPATVNERTTGVAGAKVPLPAWLAVRLHVPPATSVSVVPLTVHTDEVVDAIVTARPELELADSAGGAVPIVWLAIAAKVIVCDAM